MIRDRELAVYDKCLHTTEDSGYRAPDFMALAVAYGFRYGTLSISEPSFVEINLDESIGLTPNLPRGKRCQDMQPWLSIELYDYLNSL
jgi:hypothetical protein